MAEEVKPTSPGDSAEGVEVVDGSPNQNKDQELKEIEEKGSEAAENKRDGGAMVPGEETAGEGEIDKSAADSSEDVEVKGEVEEETVPSGEPEVSEGVEKKGEEKEETIVGEAGVKGVDKSEKEELPAEGEVVAKEEARVDDGAGEAKPEDKGEQTEEAGTEIVEEKSEEKTEKEALVEEKPAEQGESGEKEVVAETGVEEGQSGEEETVVKGGEAETDVRAAEKEGEEKAKEEKKKDDVTQERDDVVAEEEGESAAGLVSSEELTGEAEEGVTDEEWITWKNEFLKKFNKRFNKKWVISGIAIFVLMIGLVGFLIVPNFRFSDTREVKSLEEIAGPVYDMEFFLPLAVPSGKTRFVKMTVAIELVDKGFKKEIDKKISEIREEVVNIVLTKSPKGVTSSRGKELLRKEITTSLNKYLEKYLEEDCIKNTYFTELVVL